MHRTSRRIAAFAMTAVAAATAGCAGTSDSPAVLTNVTAVTVPDDGEGTAQGQTTAAEDSAPLGTFVVSEVTGHEIVPDTAIVITVEEQQLGVQAGCNAMGGGYTIIGQTLLVETMISTMMACDEPLMEQEQWVSAFLTSKPKVTVEGGTIVLTGRGTVAETMTLVPASTALDGTIWKLDSVDVNSTTSLVPVEVRMAFGDGRVTLDAGCNVISGPAVIESNSLTAGPLISTRKACADPQVTAAETLLTTVFDGTLPMTLTGNQMTLEAKDGSRLFFVPVTGSAPTTTGAGTGSASASTGTPTITESTIAATGTETGTTAG